MRHSIWVAFFGAVLLYFPPVMAEQSALAKRCRELGKNGEFLAAARLVDKYEKTFPRDEEAIHCRGIVKLRMGDKIGSINDLELSYSYDQTNLRVLVNIIEVYFELNNVAKACQKWKFLKYKNLTASRVERIDFDDPMAYKWDSICS